MSASALLDKAPSQQDGAPSRRARLDALRAAGQRLDPARLHYLEVLSRRIATAPDALRCVLEARIDAALTEFEDRLLNRQTAARDSVAKIERESPVTPLFELNQYLQRAMHNATDHLEKSSFGHSLASEGGAHAEMASVRRFREVWSRIAAEDQVTKAAGRGSDNAGPLNSHRLVLHSLALLRDLSPHYLERFLSHVQTLQWLERSSRTLTPVKVKPAGRSRVKK